MLLLNSDILKQMIKKFLKFKIIKYIFVEQSKDCLIIILKQNIRILIFNEYNSYFCETEYFHAYKCTTENQIYIDHKLLLCTKCLIKTDIVMVRHLLHI